MSEEIQVPSPALEWHRLVEKTLKGAPLESLNGSTPEGLAFKPLYDSPATAPGLDFAPRTLDRPWDLRAASAHPDPARANANLLEDLTGGAASISLTIDPTGETGLAIGSVDDLGRALQGVILDLAPVCMEAGYLAPTVADWLATLAKGSPAAPLHFHMDPLGTLARSGTSPGPIAAHLAQASAIAVRLSDIHPQAGLFLASGRSVHEAGGGDAGEVAFAAASALTYARALVDAGLPMAQAWQGIHLGLAADGDYFLTIAKLRAARALWGRMTRACGVTLPARIEVRSSRRMLTVQDPWTNMLRLGAACAGAALGGADAIILGTFTDAMGLPTRFARRQSRNAQLVLMEEAHLGRVTDPAAGSGYIEALTDEIARAAWVQVQAIEAKGGLIAALEAGDIAAEVARVHAARLAEGKPGIVGVTAFPPEAQAPVEVDSAVRRPVSAPDPRQPGPDTHCPPLVPVRLAQMWETQS